MMLIPLYQVCRSAAHASRSAALEKGVEMANKNMTGWIGKAKVTKDYVDRLGYRHITIDGKEHVFTWNAQPNSRAAEQKMHPTSGGLTAADELSKPVTTGG